MDNTTKALIKAECERILQLLDGIETAERENEDTKKEVPDYLWYDKTVKPKAELKNKMKELRRDTIRLEKEMTCPWMYDEERKK